MSPTVTLKVKVGTCICTSDLSHSYTGMFLVFMPYSCNTWIGVFPGLAVIIFPKLQKSQKAVRCMSKRGGKNLWCVCSKRGVRIFATCYNMHFSYGFWHFFRYLWLCFCGDIVCISSSFQMRFGWNAQKSMQKAEAAESNCFGGNLTK